MALKLQIAKIVGQPEKDFWSQVHTFLPKDKEKRRKYGNLLLALTLSKKTKSKLDLASYGREIIQRFHETYFSSEKKKIFSKLKEAIKRLEEEFSQELKFDLIAAIVSGQTLYLARKGKARAFVKRGEKQTLIFSSSKEKVASGKLRDGDGLILATGWFFASISLKLLAEVFQEKAQEIAENLAAQVSGSLDNSRIAALVVKTEKKVSPKTKPSLTLPKFELRFELRAEKLGAIFGWVRTKVSQVFPSSRELYLKKKQGVFKKRKRLYFLIALFLISLLFLSIFLQGQKKASRVEGEALEKALHFYEEAETLITLNPLRSRELLDQALELLGEEKLSEPERTLKEKIASLKEQVSREYQVESSRTFQDLSLIREGTMGEKLALEDEQLLILDKKAGVVLALNIVNKSGKVQAADLKEPDFVGFTSGWGFVVSSEEIMGGTLEDTAWGKLKEKDWGRVVDSVAFGGSLYLLDKDGQVLKYVAIEGGLADKREYLTEKADFSEAVSLAIDGSVWVLKETGEIRKFTRGFPDAFTILGLDKAFTNPKVLYTDENLENLYILDQNNTRVVVLAKSGEYQAQYIWGGIAGVDDLVASEEEGKILLLARDKIYEIEIKE